MFVSMELLQCGLANEEREPCQHLTAGLPCATWIMSSDNESCAKSQHDLWDPLPPPLLEVRGACRGAGLLRVSPATVLPSVWGRGHRDIRGIDQLAGADSGPAAGSCRPWGSGVAVPYCPPPDPRGTGRTGQFICCCLSSAVAAPKPSLLPRTHGGTAGTGRVRGECNL